MISLLSFSAYYQILAYFTLGFGIFLSILIYSANPKAIVNRLFILFIFSTLIWSTLPYFINFIGTSKAAALFYLKIGYACGGLSGCVGYFLTTRLFPKIQKNRSLDIIITALGFFIFPLALSPFLIVEIDQTVWGISPIFGLGKLIFFPIITFFGLLVLYLLIKGYKTFDAEEKSQFFYFIIGFIIFLILAVPALAILPLSGISAAKYWLAGCLGPILFSFFAAIAIFKKQAFEVKAILTNFLVGIFGIILLILPFFSSGITQIISTLLFVLFIIIGYLLIAYTYREVNQKEIMEERVNERTKELLNAHKEIGEGKKELDKFYKLTVGRELKMIELKEEIKKMNAKR